MGLPTTTMARAGALVMLTGLAAGTPARAADAGCAALGAEHAALKGRALTVGISPAPANYSATDPADPSSIVGIEPDLLKGAAQCLGFTFTYAKLDFAGLIPALQAGRIDVIAAGMYASAERAKQVDFVEYMKAGEASLVRAGNPKGLKSLADVCDVTAAEVVGTVENAILEKQGQACAQAGKGPITPLSFPSVDRAYSALAQGRADIFLTDAGVASYLAATTPDKVAVGFGIATDFVFGFGVAKKDKALSEALHASLEAQHEDGTMASLLHKWGFDPAQMHEPAIRTQ